MGEFGHVRVLVQIVGPALQPVGSSQVLLDERRVQDPVVLGGFVLLSRSAPMDLNLYQPKLFCGGGECEKQMPY